MNKDFMLTPESRIRLKVSTHLVLNSEISKTEHKR